LEKTYLEERSKKLRRCSIVQGGFIVSFVFLLISSNVIAGTLIITWSPNAESDLAGYKIYFGTQSHLYTDVIDVGNVDSYEFDFLTDSVQYYFALSAYDHWNNESSLSLEVSGIPGVGEVLPTNITLHPNYPNPFSSEYLFTWIQYDLPRDGQIEISIFDSLGRLVKKITQTQSVAGANGPISWNGKDHTGRDVPSGNYFCRIISEDNVSNTINILRIR